MIAALIVAAATATATPAVPHKPYVSPPKQAEPMPNFYSQPAKCGPVGQDIARRIQTATRGRMAATYAVLRRVDGCSVPTPVGYHPDYLAPGAADPQSAKPAGER
jgi:hypothetical protein